MNGNLKMKKIAALCVSILITSCGSLTTTEGELLAINGKSPMYCSDIEADTLKRNVEDHINRCYLNKKSLYMNGAMVSDGNMFQLVKKDLDGVTQYNFLTGKYYTSAIFIHDTKNQNCKSKLQVFINVKSPSSEHKAFKQYKDLSEGKSSDCF
jgi:hypothetical protein